MSHRDGPTYEQLMKARPANVQRLARALGLRDSWASHHALCAAIRRWYKRNPQPRRDRR